MPDQKMKIKSVLAEHDGGSGLVSEDVFHKVFTTSLRMLGRNDVDTGLLFSIMDPYRCAANPKMIDYVSFLDYVLPSPDEVKPKEYGEGVPYVKQKLEDALLSGHLEKVCLKISLQG
eukprot:gnl/MRDRNA2_/MRDRNA2_153269_c0_seq1.p1 gnl/MRDRNA2_/MRDRNA2_153269_c0~~gnl/MRDRNA2_/MRDRNA2_153269_c0_seq1.p1  ORF type:complete len:117 (-),score=22.77 gnl/MRDRNA2_/MRDRNA2_153269_c0_seq1:173-523(-)